MMYKRLQKFIDSIRPFHKENEGFSLDAQCIPEKIFYKIVDGIRFLFGSKINRKENLFFDHFILDTTIFFLVFYSICLFFYVIPMMSFPTESSKDIIWSQTLVIILIGSILWGGYVYIIQFFKNLTREKIIPAHAKKQFTVSDYPNAFRQFFEGFQLKWKSGLRFNFYLRSSFVCILLLFSIFLMEKNQLSEIIYGVFFSHSLDALIALYFSIFAISIIAIVTFMIFQIIVTVPTIFFYLLISIQFLPLEINIFHDLGGTGEFGKIIVNCILIASIAIGVVPFTPLITQINLNSFHVTLPDETLGNATTIVKAELAKTISAIPLDSISKFYGYFELFLILVILALIMILALHYKIKRKKYEELKNLEIRLSETDFSQSENQEKNLYYLALYEKVSSSTEWPIRKIFALELLLSTLPLMISILIQ